MRIQMAYDRKIGGRKRKADSIINVDQNTARALIHAGLARMVEEAPAKPVEEPAANTNSKEEVDSE